MFCSWLRKYWSVLAFLWMTGTVFGTVVITFPQDATPVERNAAKELCAYFQKIYADDFVVGENDAAATVRIGGADALNLDLGDDGFSIVCDGKKLVICGGSREGRGILFGVYEYLERVGCRFLPKRVESLPRYNGFELKAMTVRESPAFPDLRFVVTSMPPGVKLKANGTCTGWSSKGKGTPWKPELGIPHDMLPSAFHTTFFFMPPAKYAKTHLDFYALRNGNRMTNATQGELCMSNPEMTREFIKNCREYLKESYKKGIILVVCQQDNQNFCQCDRCNKINAEEGCNGGTQVRFVNQVASELEKDYPTMPIMTFGYQYTRFPPKTPYHKNVVVNLCNIECDFSKAFEGTEANLEFGELLKQWEKKCSRIFFLDYGANYNNMLLPLPNFEALGARLRMAQQHHVTGVNTINTHGADWVAGEFTSLRSFLTSKLYWNPNLDPWKITDDFCVHYYGKGGQYLADYLRFYHKALKNETFYNNCQPLHRFDGAYLKTAENYFAKAFEASKGNEVFLERIDREYLSIRIMKMLYLKRVAQGTPEFKEAVDDFERTCKKYKIKSFAESTNAVQRILDNMRLEVKEQEFCKGHEWSATRPGAILAHGWGKRLDDPKAAGGRTVSLNTAVSAWAIQTRTNGLPGYNTDVRYDAYARVCVVPQKEVSPDTEVFKSGAFLWDKKWTTQTTRLKQCTPNEYCYVKIAENFPVTQDGYVWMSPCRNQDKIKELRIDHIIFVQLKKGN